MIGICGVLVWCILGFGCWLQECVQFVKIQQAMDYACILYFSLCLLYFYMYTYAIYLYIYIKCIQEMKQAIYNWKFYGKIIQLSIITAYGHSQPNVCHINLKILWNRTKTTRHILIHWIGSSISPCWPPSRASDSRDTGLFLGTWVTPAPAPLGGPAS